MSRVDNIAALEAYLVGHDVGGLAEDAVFTDMNSGRQALGPARIQGMLDWVYRVAFDATFEPSGRTVDDERAVIEGTLVGRHTGEFAGVPPTGRDVRVPMAIVYRFRDGRIAGANIYLAVGAFVAQVTAPGVPA